MEDDAEHMRLPDGEMPRVGGRLPGIEEESIEGGINLSEELAEEAKAEAASGALGDPVDPQTMLEVLFKLAQRSIESNDAMTRMFGDMMRELKQNKFSKSKKDSILATVPTNSSEAREPFPEKYRIDSITEGVGHQDAFVFFRSVPHWRLRIRSSSDQLFYLPCKISKLHWKSRSLLFRHEYVVK